MAASALDRAQDTETDPLAKRTAGAALRRAMRFREGND